MSKLNSYLLKEIYNFTNSIFGIKKIFEKKLLVENQKEIKDIKFDTSIKLKSSACIPIFHNPNVVNKINITGMPNILNYPHIRVVKIYSKCYQIIILKKSNFKLKTIDNIFNGVINEKSDLKSKNKMISFSPKILLVFQNFNFLQSKVLLFRNQILPKHFFSIEDVFNFNLSKISESLITIKPNYLREKTISNIEFSYLENSECQNCFEFPKIIEKLRKSEANNSKLLLNFNINFNNINSDNLKLKKKYLEKKNELKALKIAFEKIKQKFQNNNIDKELINYEGIKKETNCLKDSRMMFSGEYSKQKFITESLKNKTKILKLNLSLEKRKVEKLVQLIEYFMVNILLQKDKNLSILSSDQNNFDKFISKIDEIFLFNENLISEIAVLKHEHKNNIQKSKKLTINSEIMLEILMSEFLIKLGFNSDETNTIQN